MKELQHLMNVVTQKTCGWRN